MLLKLFIDANTLIIVSNLIKLYFTKHITISCTYQIHKKTSFTFISYKSPFQTKKNGHKTEHIIFLSFPTNVTEKIQTKPPHSNAKTTPDQICIFDYIHSTDLKHILHHPRNTHTIVKNFAYKISDARPLFRTWKSGFSTQTEKPFERLECNMGSVRHVESITYTFSGLNLISYASRMLRDVPPRRKR